MLKTNADTKPSTAKLSTIQEQRSIMRALITSRNSPSVSIVTGSANNLMIGLMKVLSRAKTTATMMRVTMPSPELISGKVTPGVIHAEMPMAMHDNNSLTIKLIVI